MKSKRSDEPPYNRVIEVADEYEKFRRKIINSNYSSFGSKVPHSHRNWKHFSRATKLIREQGASPSEWMAAQFYGANSKQYPYPNNLYSDRAKNRYKEYLRRQKLPSLIEQQESNLQFFKERFNLDTDEEVVANPFWNFSPWFRCLFLSEIRKEWAKKTKKALQSSSLRKALDEKGYDVIDLERRVEAALV